MLTIFDVMKWKGTRIVKIDTETGKMEDITDSMDYVKVIRCKYCQSWKGKECNLPEHGWCGTLQMLTHAGDYCAWSPNLDEEKE